MKNQSEQVKDPKKVIKELARLEAESREELCRRYVE
jgi:hypothetical protein